MLDVLLLHLIVDLADADGKQPSKEPTGLPDLATKISWFWKRQEEYGVEIWKCCFDGWKFKTRVARREGHEQVLAG